MTVDTPPPFDVAAFIVAHHARLRRNVSRLLGVLGGELDDVMQDSYLTLLRRRKEITSTSDAYGMVLVAAKRLSIDNARRRLSRRTDPVAEFTADAAGVDIDPGTIVADADAIARIVAEARQVLTESQHRAWVAVDVEGRSYDEAAAFLGWSRSKLNAALQRGRLRLRERPELFDAIVCSVVLLPRRLHEWLRSESTALGAVGAVASLAVLAAAPGVVAPTARGGAAAGAGVVAAPAMGASRAATTPSATSPTALSPRDPRPVRVISVTAPRSGASGGRAVTRCLPGHTVCVGRGDAPRHRYGHA